ncbi:hypothetical protein HPB48_006866 [Haemaphysalis longicornis]|uniref:Uncharacterized protein n=1 Tax=Haemaphysalis longicornis TaxID=44386 RepID=A0A9J6FG40_HAELO|nr:hypothetical protein HPB48_006866 [Haemaphysalis longicornis]
MVLRCQMIATRVRHRSRGRAGTQARTRAHTKTNKQVVWVEAELPFPCRQADKTRRTSRDTFRDASARQEPSDSDDCGRADPRKKKATRGPVMP